MNIISNFPPILISIVTHTIFIILEFIIQIYSWKTWENEAKTIAIQSLQGSENLETSMSQ